MAERRTTPSDPLGGQTPAITDLIDKSALQAFQDEFSEKWHVPTAILDASAQPITYEYGHCPYCTKIREFLAGYRLCRKSDLTIIRAVLRTGEPCWRTCKHGRLRDFAAPLRIAGKIVAFFFIGQIRSEEGPIRKHLAYLRSQARKEHSDAPVDVRKLVDLYERIPTRPSQELERLERAATEFAGYLSKVLDKIANWQRPRDLAGFVAQLTGVGDFDALFDVCVREVPRLMETQNCSILTVVQREKAAEPLLVLQRTSYGPSRKHEGRKSYPQGQGLTGWVWKHRRALRLQNIKDPSELARYPGLRHSQTVNDSRHHREWLGVPLFGWRHDVIGVLRVPEKTRTPLTRGEGFTFEDEVLLTTIGQHIAHRMEELRVRERVQTALRASQDCALALSRVTNTEGIISAVLAACERVFGLSGKAHLFNILTDDAQHLRIEGIAGDLGRRRLCGLEFSLMVSLSGFCVRKGRPRIIHDVKAAKARREYFPAIKDIQCGMVTPLVFGKKKYGALAVGANKRYEFREDPDLHILQDLGTLASAALARLDAQEQARASLRDMAFRMGHVLRTKVHILDVAVTAMKDVPSKALEPELTKLRDAVDYLKSGVHVALATTQPRTRPTFRKFVLGEPLERLRRLYPDARIEWSIIPPGLSLHGDPYLILEAVEQLLVNSLDHISRGTGRIWVRAFRERDPRLRTKGPYACVIEVANNGPSIPFRQKEKIFQPYFAGDDRHLGLGLSFVMTMAKAHNGYAYECGQPRKGACFRIVIPD